MLLNPRCRGLYLHGTVKKVRRTAASSQGAMRELARTLDHPEELREAFRAVFPGGVRLLPLREGKRQIWMIEARPISQHWAGSRVAN
jgi:hypothetical protein